MSKYLKLEEGWLTLFILWAMMFVSGLAVYQTDLIGGLEVIPTISTVGLLVGLVLAKSTFSDRTAHTFSVVYGLFVFTYFIGALLPGDLVWRERVFDIVTRQGAWIQKVFDGTTNRDGLIFVMHTSVVYWLLGYTAAWYTFRRPQVWRVVLPSGLVLLSVVYYYFGPKPLVVYLGVYAILSLIYIAQTHLVDQERGWRAASVRYENLIRYNFVWSSLVAGALALGIAWSLPALTANAAVSDAINDFSRPWHQFQDNWTRLFASLRSYGAGSNDPYSSSLVLGGPRTVGDKAIMDVYTREQLPYVYWQAVAFDTYQGGSWAVSETERVIQYPDDEPIDLTDTRAREAITQTVHNYVANSGTLYSAPQMVSSDKQMFVDRRLTDQGREDVTSIKSRFQLQLGETYEVLSMMSFVDAQSLRSASTNYPAWITENYLQLPDTISPETLELAAELNEMADNPFDLSILIRDFLRNEISYNDQIQAPPDGIDPVHYVLFDLKEGYCNYYASAMVVLLRQNGVPARLVAGYAQGEYLEEDGFYRVRASNAHTWVETYFPGYGWIQFEPTASIPIVERPETGGGGDSFGSSTSPFADIENLFDQGPLEDQAPLGGDIDIGEDENINLDLSNSPFGQASSLQIVLGILIVVVAGGAVATASLIGRQIDGDVVRSYGRLDRWAKRLGLPVRQTHTPYERASYLTAAVPDGRGPIRNLTQQFVLRTFSERRQSEPGFDPRQEWSALRPALWRSMLRHLLDRLRVKGGAKEPKKAMKRDIFQRLE